MVFCYLTQQPPFLPSSSFETSSIGSSTWGFSPCNCWPIGTLLIHLKFPLISQRGTPTHLKILPFLVARSLFAYRSNPLPLGNIGCQNIGVELVPLLSSKLLSLLGDSPFVKVELRFFVIPFSFLLGLSRFLYLVSIP